MREPTRVSDADVYRWVGPGDRGYDELAGIHSEFACPRCGVLFALDVDGSIVGVCHEISCPVQ